MSKAAFAVDEGLREAEFQNTLPGHEDFAATGLVAGLVAITPACAFVGPLGAIGIGGPIDDPKNGQYGLRVAQIAPASMPEFKGNVAAIRTEKYWDMELKRIQEKLSQAAEKKLKAENPKLGGRALQRASAKKAKSVASEVLTPTELKLRETGTSNAAYHYMGSAYIYGNIGKAFAEAMVKMK